MPSRPTAAEYEEAWMVFAEDPDDNADIFRKVLDEPEFKAVSAS